MLTYRGNQKYGYVLLYIIEGNNTVMCSHISDSLSTSLMGWTLLHAFFLFYAIYKNLENKNLQIKHSQQLPAEGS